MGSGRITRRQALLGSLIAGAAPWLHAQPAAWSPARPVKLISPFPPGGTTDLVARVMAEYLSTTLGQPTVVDNRAGAGGVVGMEALVRSPADGQTISIMSSSHAAAASLRANLPYDAVKGVEPLGLVTKVGLVLVTAAGSKYNTLQDFLAAARQQPGRLSLASAGAGNANHLVIEFLREAARVDVLHVPYRGGGQAMADVVGGQVDGMFNPVSSVLPLVTGGKLKALAIASAQRAKVLPDVPTMHEAGLPGFESYEWYGLTAPAGLPANIAARYEADLRTILSRPDVAARLAQAGLEIVYQDPREFRRFFESEVASIGRIVRQNKITID